MSRLIEKQITQERLQKISAVETTVKSVLQEVSISKDFIIISNFFNKMSLDIICNGGIPKPHTISLQTEREGIFGGYILADKNSINSYPIAQSFKNSTVFFERTKEGIDIKKTFPKNSVYALVNKDQRYITSDFDILMICGRGVLDIKKMSYTHGMGDILRYEFDLSQEINRLFTQQVVAGGFYNSQEKKIPLIQHGPFNRYPKFKLTDIHFPLTIYHPKNGIITLGNELEREKSLRDFMGMCNIFRREGYKIELNDNWTAQ